MFLSFVGVMFFVVGCWFSVLVSCLFGVVCCLLLLLVVIVLVVVCFCN